MLILYVPFCISGIDGQGRAVNISTQNVLAERNTILQGHGLTIGSDMSAGVRNVVFRCSQQKRAQNIDTSTDCTAVPML